MARNDFTENEFADWLRESWSLYSSETIWVHDAKVRLRMWANHAGNIRVTAGDCTLYEGKHFHSAKDIYDHADQRTKCTCCDGTGLTSGVNDGQ